MIDRFLSEKWDYDKLYDYVIITDNDNNSRYLQLTKKDKDPEAYEDIRLVTAAPTMYGFLVDLLQDEQLLHNPVKIALTAQKILMRINGELRFDHD